MRKVNLIAAAVLAMAMTACNTQELELNDYKLGEDEFGFAIEKVTATRASAEEAPAPVTFELGNSGFYLTETVTELDYDTPATKGTPIYTENIDQYYPAINVVGYKVGGDAPYVADASYEYMKPYEDTDDGLQKIYQHHYASDFWPAESDEQELYFFLRAPESYISSTTSNLTYGTSDGSIEFDYTSKYKGSEQQDMLFTSRTLTKAQYKSDYHPNGAPVTFYHALTGVKFRVGSANEGTTKTIITGVKFSGLKDKGHCVITPTKGKASKENVAWDNLEEILGTFSMGFKDDLAYDDMGVAGNEDNKPIDNSIDYKSETEGEDGETTEVKVGNFGDSWYSAAASKNLNDEDGSLTFWFIPQQLTEHVVLEVTFCVKTPDTPNGTEITHTIKFGDLARTHTKDDDGNITYGEYPTWEAGQLRTYTLDPKDVDVDIFDEMTTYLKKENLRITNTGNVDEYVRMMLIGNWYGWLPDQNPASDEPSILVGYTTSDVANDTMVDNWYFKDSTFGDGFDDTFKYGVPANGNKWKLGTGSYYYYPDVIGAGDKLSSTSTLFQSYEFNEDWLPNIWIPVGGVREKAKDVHLVFECAVQAIAAPITGYDETTGKPIYMSCWEAWSAATGETISEESE